MPPQNLTATAASGTEIDLAWTAAVETGGTISNYVVQRCLADAGINSTGQPCAAGFATLATIPATATTYQGIGLTGGVFNYRVQAIDGSGNLALFSNTATASVPDTASPSMPTVSLGANASRHDQPNQFELEQFDGQCRSNRLSGGTLRRTQLQQFCPDRHFHNDNLR